MVLLFVFSDDIGKISEILNKRNDEIQSQVYLVYRFLHNLQPFLLWEEMKIFFFFFF